MDVGRAVAAVVSCLSDDLRTKKYRGHPNPLAGHCYVASEALRHLLGAEWAPQQMWHDGVSHWFLKHRLSGEVLDPTATQFRTPPDYSKAKGRGFLTRMPCKRTQRLLDRVSSSLQISS